MTPAAARQGAEAELRRDRKERPAPRIARRMPEAAVPVALEATIEAAGLEIVWSGSVGLPTLYLHPGAEDVLVVPRDGVRICCLGAGSLPESDPERAREAVCRLAYGFRHWAAHAALVRRHEALERELAK